MRRAVPAAPILIVGCASAQPPIHGTTAGHDCRPLAAGSFIGQQATSESAAAILSATQAAVLRWAPPGVMLTMEYREDRVTVRIGEDGRIAGVSCG